jgi:ABC-type lipoprotein export system ATPase subunit
MSLLVIDSVSKRYRRGRREHVALRDVSLVIESGELLAVVGSRKSGRSTLLRVAAGLEQPDEGTVRFQARPLARARDVVGRQIAYCHTSFSPLEGEFVSEHVMAALLARGAAPARARRAAEAALRRLEADACARMRPSDLTAAEAARVAFARGLIGDPALLVIDDPTAGVGTLETDDILNLLRSTADEGIAVLMSSDDATCASGSDRALSLDDGRLLADAEPPQADVVPLRPTTLGAG